jgi:hydroxymethylpyrimidine pyrophosphatase-like HAD family hydrolase
MLGVARDEVIAFGDSHNDLDMLEFAGVGVAMGNASAEVKALADLITDSNEDDGIATALERLGVI